ncbi:MAG: hypothetical protein JRE16_12390 [Deltaproteobacteria bacterium]|jgi:hypothetical protein|nr:hypothetical protein [Deltaproteobacteria bacterium]MBW2518905.1 hypothetical protein [Deltaproteobacteria bacterium]
MHIPESTKINECVLEEIINGARSVNFEFLAANILTQHIQSLYAEEPSEENLRRYRDRLKKLLVENADLPSVQNDLAKIQALES